MAKSARRRPKHSSGSSPSPCSSTAGPIPPFAKAPPIIEPFLQPLSHEEVFLIHIDGSPIPLKAQAFRVPVVLNVVIAIIIAIRAYMGLSTYPPLLGTLLGFKTSMAVDTSTMSFAETARIILRRTTTFIIDYFLVTLLLAWPIRFVRGPVKWRRAIGFRDREIIVRRSQASWSRLLARNTWIRDDEAMRDRIVAAVTPARIAKTGYLLVDADWDLDYDAMIRAHALVGAMADKGKEKGCGGAGDPPRIPWDEFRTAVLVHTDSDGWLVWRVGDEDNPEGRARSRERDQILAVRDKLTAIGKEELFYRWVELVQYESSQPGGFTPERQQSAMLQTKKLFEDEDLDFDEFWKEENGRMDGFPSLD